METRSNSTEDWSTRTRHRGAQLKAAFAWREELEFWSAAPDLLRRTVARIRRLEREQYADDVRTFRN